MLATPVQTTGCLCCILAKAGYVMFCLGCEEVNMGICQDCFAWQNGTKQTGHGWSRGLIMLLRKGRSPGAVVEIPESVWLDADQLRDIMADNQPNLQKVQFIRADLTRKKKG